MVGMSKISHTAWIAPGEEGKNQLVKLDRVINRTRTPLLQVALRIDQAIYD